MDSEQTEDGGDTKHEAVSMVRLKTIWSCCTAERVPAAATVILAPRRTEDL